MCASLGRHLDEDMQGDRPHQRHPVRETPVQRGDAHPSPTGDVLQRNVDTLLNEHVASGLEQPFPVPQRVDPHRPMMTDSRAHRPAPSQWPTVILDST
jgi:hypothetical protein